MQPPKRKHEPGVMALLLAEPHRFRFAQLLNILLGALRRRGIAYDRAFGEVLRFRNSVSLGFPASEVAAIEVVSTSNSANTDAADAILGDDIIRIRITPAFIGLLGACGTLPLHDTERIAARQSIDGDASQRELIDVLSNRMIGLFYEAWGKYRIEHGIDIRGHDRARPMLLALAGARHDRGQRRHGINGQLKDDTAAHYAGLLGTRPVSAATVERIMSEYFDVPIQLEQFVGCWDSIPERRRSTLGTAMPTLGQGAALGVRLWRHDIRARLNIGPLEEAQVRDFLPGGSAMSALQEMVKLFAVPVLRYEIRLRLAAPCVKRMTLATRTEPRQLGWNTFLTSTPGSADRPEIRSLLQLARPARAKAELTAVKTERATAG